jgi:predicted permease
VEANERRLFFDPHVYWVEMMARLRPGVSLEQAQTSLGHQFREFVLSTATSDKERSVLPQLWLEPGASGLDSLRQDYSKPLYVLITMVALILTIACANIANLLLARSAARRREIAVRLSLGAGRARIVRQLLTESVGLSLVGGALGVLVAFWGIRFITWVIANGQENFSLHAELNWPVLGFTLTLALAAGMLFGLAPALQATKVNLSPALKEAAGAAVPGKRWQFLSLSRVLVCAQIAMSLLLVFGASLFVRTMANLHSVDVGFNRDNVLLFSVNARQAGYQNEALARFYADLATRIRALPGVRAAGMSNFPLAARYVNSEGVSIPGMPALDPRHSEVDTLSVDDGFMDAMQIPVLLGRGLSQRDIGTHGMAVVNQKFAEAFFAGANPLGRVFVLGGPRDPHQYEIVGVSRSTHYNSLKEELQPVAYLPYTQNLNDLRQMFFEVRTAGDPLTALNPIRAIVHEASAAVSINDVSTQSRIIEQTISQEHTFADLCTCFAALALAIACVGLYGSISYAVARRTRELGIRMALGAERGAIVWMVLRQALILAAVGLAIGLFVAQQMAHLVASFLWNMKPGDPAAIAISIAILFTASVAASFVPAWRASRTDPMLAIRHE